jgi:oligoribonuclease
MDALDDWNKRQHGASGLAERVLQSTATLADAEAATLRFLGEWVNAGASPMAGNSICQDRRFLAREMPALEKYFHYRNLDVSTLKILAQLWAPQVAAGFNKESAHRALSDIRDSIAELAWYRSNLLSAGVLGLDA